MNSLYLSFSVVFPLFIMMTLGYILRVINIFNDDFVKQLNNLCFKVFLPTILFINVYKSDFDKAFSPKLIIFSMICICISFIGLMLIIPMIQKNNKKRGVMIQGICRSNFILFGIPMTASLFGDENTSTTAILIAFIVPLLNVLSVVALETYGSETKTSISKILKQVIKNPLIIASFIAFIFVFTGIKLPEVVDKSITDISKIATPLSLILLGGTFTFTSLNHSIKELIISVIGKLILIPLIFIPICILMGFRDLELIALFAMIASPTAVSSYTMAQNMNGDHELAGQIVVMTSICSILTIFIWISVLSQFGFI